MYSMSQVASSLGGYIITLYVVGMRNVREFDFQQDHGVKREKGSNNLDFPDDLEHLVTAVPGAIHRYIPGIC